MDIQWKWCPPPICYSGKWFQIDEGSKNPIMASKNLGDPAMNAWHAIGPQGLVQSPDYADDFSLLLPWEEKKKRNGQTYNKKEEKKKEEREGEGKWLPAVGSRRSFSLFFTQTSSIAATGKASQYDWSDSKKNLLIRSKSAGCILPCFFPWLGVWAPQGTWWNASRTKRKSASFILTFLVLLVFLKKWRSGTLL